MRRILRESNMLEGIGSSRKRSMARRGRGLAKHVHGGGIYPVAL
jgi:hypothetical protein